MSESERASKVNPVIWVAIITGAFGLLGAIVVVLGNRSPSQQIVISPSPSPTFTITPSPTSTATPSPTNTLTPTSTPTPTNTPAPQPLVTLDKLIEFNDPPRVDVTFSAQNIPATYKPMVVVEDWIGNLFGWTHIEGAGSGTYKLTGITIGTVDADCDKIFTIHIIMTLDNRVAGQINQLPAGYRTQTTVARQC